MQVNRGSNSLLMLDFFIVCPAGFVLIPGDLPGMGQIESNPSIEESVLDCSDKCNDETNCCSFEYSGTEKKCNLNSDCQPTQAVYKDYSFCSKGNSVRFPADY